ncbi:MAG TPA: sulfatase-like hydrolase/transferase, partial [Polyangiaceae bacterium]
GRAVFAVFVGTSAGTITALATTGRHFAGVVPRVGTTAFVALLTGAIGFFAAPLASRLLRERPVLFAAAALAKGVGLEVLNGLVLVRLYPAFHAGLAGYALLIAPFVILPVLPISPRADADRRPGLTLLLGTLAVVALSAGFVGPAAERLSRFDNFRLIFAESAPMLGEAVRIAAVIAPPPPIEATDPCLLDPAACGNSGSARTDAGPSFEGRDVVLLSIDALRADHVGAYGYARKTTPNIDALAEGAAVFEHAYCPTPHTSYSVTSLMTGKYMRPLLLQGTGQDSETLATFLRRYGYRTAAFYPPAVFFIDQARFEPFERSHYGFEYGKVEFMEGEGRVAQIADYVRDLPSPQRLLLWVHLFGPHEPYEAHPEHPFGERDVDRYDSEIATADATVGAIVDLVRKARPKAVVIVTADHGEEFGDHGGRYHGTTVYEEQVRVPLLISAPGAVPARRIATVVQTIDLLPTLLSALSIPPSPRIRGRDLGPLLLGEKPGVDPGIAFAETEENALLAKGNLRLVCARKLGACRLFDIEHDALEREDLRATQNARFTAMRGELSALEASHGRFEVLGERTETGKGYPPAIRRAIAGDSDAAPDLAALLDDADRDIRRKAAELLFSFHRPDTTPALRLALGRDEDPDVRKWCALALTRLGETAPLVTDLLQGTDTRFRRFAALALAESGDAHGEGVLVDWWQHGGTDDYERALEILGAFTRIKAKDAVWPLLQSLKNVRLRPRIAQTLASIGDDVARGPLVAALLDERYQTARVAITDALVALGAKEELARPLIRFLGVPDPIPGGVGSAHRAKILDLIGGPDDKTLRSLPVQSNVGALVRLVIPKAGNGTGIRVIVRARSQGRSGEVRVGRRLEALQYDSKGSALNTRQAPKIHDRDFVSLPIPDGPEMSEVSAPLPASVLGIGGRAAAGRAIELVVFAEQHVTLEALVVVPLADELPPPAPEPWKKPAPEAMAPATPAGP